MIRPPSTTCSAAGIVRIEAELAALDAAEPVLDRREAEAEAADKLVVRARIETKLDETLAKLTTASGQVADHVDKLAESVAAAEGLEADAAALAKSLRLDERPGGEERPHGRAHGRWLRRSRPSPANPPQRLGSGRPAALRAPRTTRPRPGRAPFMAGEMPGTARRSAAQRNRERRWPASGG